MHEVKWSSMMTKRHLNPQYMAFFLETRNIIHNIWHLLMRFLWQITQCIRGVIPKVLLTRPNFQTDRYVNKTQSQSQILPDI